MTTVDLAVFSIGWLLGWLLLWRTRPLPSVRSRAREPLAAIVPARNEAHSIGDVVDRIVAQLRPGDEFVVVDDHSDDGTAVIARSRGARVVSTAPAPGWLGKPHACWRGAATTAAPDAAVHRRRRAPGGASPRRHRGRGADASRRGGVGAAVAPHRALVRTGEPAVQRGRADGIGRVHRARRPCPPDRGVRAGARDAARPLRRGRRARGRPRSAHGGHRSRPTGRWRSAVHRSPRHHVPDVPRRLASAPRRLDPHHRRGSPLDPVVGGARGRLVDRGARRRLARRWSAVRTIRARRHRLCPVRGPVLGARTTGRIDPPADRGAVPVGRRRVRPDRHPQPRRRGARPGRRLEGPARQVATPARVDANSDVDQDLADVGVRLHPSMAVGDVVEREPGIDDRSQDARHRTAAGPRR